MSAGTRPDRQSETALAARIRAGDDDARWELVLAYLPLCGRWARRYAGRGVAAEDLAQEGTLGLLRATRDFDPERFGARFGSYAERWVRAYMMRAVSTRQDPHRAVAAIDELAAGDGPAEEALSHREERLILEAGLRTLSPVEAWLLRERYGLDLVVPASWTLPDGSQAPVTTEDGAYYHRSYAELSELTGLSRIRLQQIEREGLAKLRRALGGRARAPSQRG